jgi:hypothetical protein
VATKEAAQIADVSENPAHQEDPQRRSFVELTGARTLIVVPMLKDNEVMGAIIIYRQEVRLFTDKQIELLRNFAAQTVIAIENARLLDDLNKLNKQLEQRVTDQVGEIERMSRLRRFLPRRLRNRKAARKPSPRDYCAVLRPARVYGLLGKLRSGRRYGSAGRVSCGHRHDHK